MCNNVNDVWIRLYSSKSNDENTSREIQARRSKDAIAPVRYLAFNPRRSRFRLDTREEGLLDQSGAFFFTSYLASRCLRDCAVEGEADDRSPSCAGRRAWWKCFPRPEKYCGLRKNRRGITPRRKSRFLLKIILRGICATTMHNRLDGAYPSTFTGTVQEGASPGGSTLNNDSFVATELPLRTRLPLLLKPTPSTTTGATAAAVVVVVVVVVITITTAIPQPPSPTDNEKVARGSHHEQVEAGSCGAVALPTTHQKHTDWLAGCYSSHKIVGESTVYKARTTYTINTVHAAAAAAAEESREG